MVFSHLGDGQARDLYFDRELVIDERGPRTANGLNRLIEAVICGR